MSDFISGISVGLAIGSVLILISNISAKKVSPKITPIEDYGVAVHYRVPDPQPGDTNYNEVHVRGLLPGNAIGETRKVIWTDKEWVVVIE